MFIGNTSYYWSYGNNSNDSSALSYIPETVWNESTNSRAIRRVAAALAFFITRPDMADGPGHSAGTARGVPDVSLTAAHNDGSLRSHRVRARLDLIGGTSASTPVFRRDGCFAESISGNQRPGKHKSKPVLDGANHQPRLSRHHHWGECRSLRGRHVRIAVPTTISATPPGRVGMPPADWAPWMPPRCSTAGASARARLRSDPW